VPNWFWAARDVIVSIFTASFIKCYSYNSCFNYFVKPVIQLGQFDVGANNPVHLRMLKAFGGFSLLFFT